MNLVPSFGILLFASIGLAQAPEANTPPKSDWDNLRSLSAGATVQVRVAEKGRIQGSFRRATGDALFIRDKKGDQTLPRDSVISVSLKGKGRRGRHMLMGLGIGAALGLAAGEAYDLSHQCHPNEWCLLTAPIGKAILTPAGAVIGFGIGAAMPAHGWQEIYRNPAVTVGRSALRRL